MYGDAPFLQRVRDARGPAGSPALARENHRSADSIMQYQPAAYELRDRGNIADGAVELVLVGRAGRTAEPRADRIDHDQVGGGKPRVGIVDQLRSLQQLRACDVEMQPRGRSARTTVPYEHHWPFGRGLGSVRRIEHVPVRLPGRDITDGDTPDLRRICQLAAANPHLVGGNDRNTIGGIRGRGSRHRTFEDQHRYCQ